MNKWEAMSAVSISNLKPQDKALLQELLLRANENFVCWPSVQRLCMARGMKYEKNFKGADHYLPGLVSKTKKGRKMKYQINVDAIETLNRAEVMVKHTPALPADTPSREGQNSPASAATTPAPEGAKPTHKTTVEPSETLQEPDAAASVSANSKTGCSGGPSPLKPSAAAAGGVTTSRNAPAVEGVLGYDWPRYRSRKEQDEAEKRGAALAAMGDWSEPAVGAAVEGR